MSNYGWRWPLSTTT